MDYLLPPHYEQAREGRYFRAMNPTIGTGIAMGVQTTFSDTANVLCLMQVAGKEVYMDYLRLICTAAGASTTDSNLAIISDSVARYSGGGTGLTVVNAQQSRTTTSAISPAFGAVTAIAANSKRQLSRIRLKTQAAPCWTIGDEVMIRFGGHAGTIGLTSGAAPAKFDFNCGPIIVSAAGSLLFHMWNTANAVTPPSWEVEMGWWEV